MKQINYARLQEKYSDEFVATDTNSGRVVAHSPSIRKLYAQLKRKGRDLTKTLVEKIEPKDTVIVY